MLENPVEIRKKWCKEAVYSPIFLVLFFVGFPLLMGITYRITDNFEFVFNVDYYVHQLVGDLWSSPTIDLAFGISLLIGSAFLVASIFFGVSSIRKTNKVPARGRMLGIISATVSCFVALVFALSLIFGFFLLV